MKKFTSLIFAFVFMIFSSFADEAVLFDSTAKADVLGTGYDWIENSRSVGVSGWYKAGKNLSNPVLSEQYGLAIRTDDAPNGDSNYAIEFVTPFFNKDESGNPISGAGLITNAAAVKEMEVTLVLNRGYDEVTIIWEQNGRENTRKFKATDSPTAIESMIEFTAHIDFTDYIKDAKNRSVAQLPVAGLRMTDIRLKRIMVTTHKAPSDWLYSPTSLVGVKKISVIYDKAVTPEAYERGKEADDVFGIQASKNLEDSTRKYIESYLRQDAYNKSLMATEGN